MTDLIQTIAREPFAVLYAASAFFVWRHAGYVAEFWTLPVVLCGWFGTYFADELWQDLRDRRAAITTGERNG